MKVFVVSASIVIDATDYSPVPQAYSSLDLASERLEELWQDALKDFDGDDDIHERYDKSFEVYKEGEYLSDPYMAAIDELEVITER